MADHLVCLTFDFDAVSPWILRGETTPTALSRGEFGVVGARRLLALLERGFRYDSSLMGQDDRPYRCRTGDVVTRDGPMRFGAETELWEMPISWSLDDHPQFEYVRRSGFLQPGLAWTGGVLENWLDDFRWMARETERGVLTYTMHPQVIGRGHRLLMLERLIAGLLELGARFVRMDEALDLMQGRTSSPLPEPPS